MGVFNSLKCKLIIKAVIHVMFTSCKEMFYVHFISIKIPIKNRFQHLIAKSLCFNLSNSWSYLRKCQWYRYIHMKEVLTVLAKWTTVAN